MKKKLAKKTKLSVPERIARDYDARMPSMIGYDDCIVGVVVRHDICPVVCYDREKLIERLMGDGMSGIDAEEYFHYNMLRPSKAEGMPCFITLYTEEKKK